MSRVKCPRGEKPVTVCLPEDTPTRMAGLGEVKCARGEVPVCTPRYAVPGLAGLDGTFKKTKAGVKLDRQPTRGSDASFPTENIFRYGPFGVAAEMMLNLPRETYMLYCFDTEANCTKYVEKVRAGAQPVLFKRGMGMQMGEGPINEIFKRTPVGCIAVYLVSVGTEKGWEGITYVDMMSVKAPWQRQNINTMMMRTLQQWQPNRKIEFSSPTHAGSAFIKARGLGGLGEAWDTHLWDERFRTMESIAMEVAARLLLRIGEGQKWEWYSLTAAQINKMLHSATKPTEEGPAVLLADTGTYLLVADLQKALVALDSLHERGAPLDGDSHVKA